MGWDGPMTHRQFLAWQEWEKLDWNEPSRADHYVMSIHASILGGKTKPSDLKIPFEFKTINNAPVTARLTPAQLEAHKRTISSEAVAQKIYGSFGGSFTQLNITPSEAAELDQLNVAEAAAKRRAMAATRGKKVGG